MSPDIRHFKGHSARSQANDNFTESLVCRKGAEGFLSNTSAGYVRRPAAKGPLVRVMTITED